MYNLPYHFADKWQVRIKFSKHFKMFNNTSKIVPWNAQVNESNFESRLMVALYLAVGLTIMSVDTAM